MSKAETVMQSGADPKSPNNKTRAPVRSPSRFLSLAPILSGAILLLVTLNGILYWKGSSIVQAHARTLGSGHSAQGGQLSELKRWNLTLTLTSLFTGVGLALFSGLGFGWWRKNVLKQVSKQLETAATASEKVQILSGDLERVVSENSRLNSELNRARSDIDARVQERTATLSKSHAQLEAELNERKQAEKALARQAQELGRSKDVLELHVQARTHELQKLKSRYESILNSAGEGIYGLDLHGKM